MNSSAQPSWRALEMLVADIHSQLMPGARVTHNAKLFGTESEIDRQIDVLIEQNLGPYSMRIVVDCKDYKSPIDVKGVEEFCGLVKDVGANSAAMVCPAGFTTTAKKRAKKLGISLFTPVDASGTYHWSKPMTLPALCIIKRGGLGIEIGYERPLPLRLPTDFPVDGTLFDADDSAMGTPLQIASKRWDAGSLPLDVGTYEGIPLFSDNRPTFVDNGYGSRVQVEIGILLEVTEQRYYGRLPLSSMRGLRDEQTGCITTNAFTTGLVSPTVIANDWQRLSAGESPPVPVSVAFQGLEAWRLPGVPIPGKWITVRAP